MLVSTQDSCQTDSQGDSSLVLEKRCKTMRTAQSVTWFVCSWIFKRKLRTRMNIKSPKNLQHLKTVWVKVCTMHLTSFSIQETSSNGDKQESVQQSIVCSILIICVFFLFFFTHLFICALICIALCVILELSPTVFELLVNSDFTKHIYGEKYWNPEYLFYPVFHRIYSLNCSEIV